MSMSVNDLAAMLRSNPDLIAVNPNLSQDKPKAQRLPAPTEDFEQEQVIQWAAINEAQYPELALLHHIPNGGMRDMATAQAMKRAGVKAGIPDLFLPVARGGHHGLWIELKRSDHSNHASADQEWWIEQLRQQGYRAVVCYGASEATAEIEDYLDNLTKCDDVV